MQNAELLKLPDIIANHVCSYLEPDDLIALSGTSKKLFETCDKSNQWEILVRKTFGESSDTIKNYRSFYRSQKYRHFFNMKVYDDKLLQFLPLEKEIRVVVLGCGGVGKSAVVIRFISDRFIEEYDPTIEDSFRKFISMGSPKNLVKEEQPQTILDILDTAGPEEYSAMHEQYQRQGDVFIIAYDITFASSFYEVSAFFKTLQRIKGVQFVPTIIIGTKMDLESQRKVTTEQGKALAHKLHCAFFETSAKENINLQEVFQETVWLYLRHHVGTLNKPRAKAARKKKCCVM